MTSVLAALGTGLCVAGLLWMLLDPPVRLHGRVAPYLARNRPFELWRARVGRRSDPRTVAGFVLSTIAEHVGDVVDGLSRDALLRRLRQARLFQETDDPAATYRVRQLLSVSGACAGSGAVAGIVGMPLGQVAAVVGLGLVVGATRQRGRLDRAIDERRRVMSIEIYTVNQLLAMRVRAGGGVIQAVTQVAARGRGEVVEELREALRLHRAGQPAALAFRRIADETPETSCARTYGFLALAEERGTDLADALLSLAEDVRESRREAIRRAATKRRAAMLIPTIAILAPVMLLFVGAPLPSLVLGFS
jgi:Flp pilus assembly protein TadB